MRDAAVRVCTRLQATKGRNSSRDKQADSLACAILHGAHWRITAATEFSVVEQMILMLCKRLNEWSRTGAPGA